MINKNLTKNAFVYKLRFRAVMTTLSPLFYRSFFHNKITIDTAEAWIQAAAVLDIITMFRASLEIIQ